MKQITNDFFAALDVVLYEDEEADCADALITEHVTDPSRLDRFVKACLIDMDRPVETTVDFWNKRVEAPDWIWIDEWSDDDNQLIVNHINNEWYAEYYSKYGFQTDASDWQLD